LRHPAQEANETPEAKVCPDEDPPRPIFEIDSAARAAGIAHFAGNDAERFLRYRRIRIDENEDVLSCASSAGVPYPRDVVRHLGNDDRVESAGQSRGRIGARVVDDDQLDRWFAGIAQKPLRVPDVRDRGGEIPLFVVRGNDDGERDRPVRRPY
jgi:hypothetical protein